MNTHSCSYEIHLTFKCASSIEHTPTVGSHIHMAVGKLRFNVGLRGRVMPACCVRVEEDEVERCIHTVMIWVGKDGCDISTRFLLVPGHVCVNVDFSIFPGNCFYICDVITQFSNYQFYNSGALSVIPVNMWKWLIMSLPPCVFTCWVWYEYSNKFFW